MLLSRPLTLLSAIAQAADALRGPLLQDVLRSDAAYKHLDLTHDLFAFHKNLTQIESITGNEKEVGEWLEASLKGQGYHVERQAITKDPLRFNVLAWPGKKRDANVLISSHIDTVPPFYPYKHDHKTVSGRGSVDAKGSVAAQIIAVNSLLDSKKIYPDDVGLLYVVGEETGGDGMRAANSLDLNPNVILFGEPTEGKLAAGHKGNLGFRIHAKGKAAHSGYPWLGRSANEVLITALAALMELVPNLPSSEKFGSTTVNIGRIEGGVAANVVPESASANIAVRIADGTTDYIKKEIVNAIHTSVAKFLDNGQKPSDIIDFDFPSAGYGPIEIDHDVPGFEVITVNYGTDIPNLEPAVKGQKRYLYGPGSILVAHSDHESLTESELKDAVRGYEKLILHVIGSGQATGSEVKYKDML